VVSIDRRQRVTLIWAGLAVVLAGFEGSILVVALPAIAREGLSERTLGGGGEMQPGWTRRPHGWSSKRTRLPCSTILFAVESQPSDAPEESAKMVRCWSGWLAPPAAVVARAQQRTVTPSRASGRPTALDFRRN